MPGVGTSRITSAMTSGGVRSYICSTVRWCAFCRRKGHHAYQSPDGRASHSLQCLIIIIRAQSRLVRRVTDISSCAVLHRLQLSRSAQKVSIQETSSTQDYAPGPRASHHAGTTNRRCRLRKAPLTR